MPRDDGVRYGAGGQPILKEIVEVPTTSSPLATRTVSKKVEVLEETIRDTLPSDIDSEEEEHDDENF
jgi:hypothetical protein